MLLSLPLDIQSGVYSTVSGNTWCIDPSCWTPSVGPPFIFNTDNQWPNGISLTCPHNSDCGVVVTVPLWNIIGNQTSTSAINSTEVDPTRTNNTTTWIQPTTFRNTTTTFQKVYALAGKLETYFDGTEYQVGRCPNHSGAQTSSAYVCYLPDSQGKANSSIPTCPAGPVYNPANPFPNGTVYLQS